MKTEAGATEFDVDSEDLNKDRNFYCSIYTTQIKQVQGYIGNRKGIESRKNVAHTRRHNILRSAINENWKSIKM